MYDISDEDIRQALEEAHGIRHIAASRLGVSARTLHRRMVKADMCYEPGPGPHAAKIAMLEAFLDMPVVKPSPAEHATETSTKATVKADINAFALEARFDDLLDYAGDWARKRKRPVVRQLTESEVQKVFRDLKRSSKFRGR